MNIAASLASQHQWDESIAEYLQLRAKNVTLDNELGAPAAKKLAISLASLFEKFIKKSKIKDSWSEMHWRTTPSGVTVHCVSKTQGHDYIFGIYANEIYLSSHVLEPQNIKNVADEFWNCFTELTTLGNFYFHENAGLPTAVINPNLNLRTGRSSIYKLIRNFTLLQEHSPDSTTDIGWYEYKWPISEQFENLESTGYKALKNIHRLNYLLYRCQRLKENARNRPTNSV